MNSLEGIGEPKLVLAPFAGFAHSLVFGNFGGSISHLSRLIIGFKSRFRGGFADEKKFHRIFVNALVSENTP